MSLDLDDLSCANCGDEVTEDDGFHQLPDGVTLCNACFEDMS